MQTCGEQYIPKYSVDRKKSEKKFKGYKNEVIMAVPEPVCHNETSCNREIYGSEQLH